MKQLQSFVERHVSLIPVLAMLYARSVAMQQDERGFISGMLVSVIGGLVVIVVGIVLLPIVISTAATTGANAQIGSFTGVQSVNDLIPLMFAVAVVGVAVFIVVRNFRGGGG